MNTFFKNEIMLAIIIYIYIIEAFADTTIFHISTT